MDLSDEEMTNEKLAGEEMMNEMKDEEPVNATVNDSIEHSDSGSCVPSEASDTAAVIPSFTAVNRIVTYGSSKRQDDDLGSETEDDGLDTDLGISISVPVYTSRHKASPKGNLIIRADETGYLYCAYCFQVCVGPKCILDHIQKAKVSGAQIDNSEDEDTDMEYDKDPHREVLRDDLNKETIKRLAVKKVEVLKMDSSITEKLWMARQSYVQLGKKNNSAKRRTEESPKQLTPDESERDFEKRRRISAHQFNDAVEDFGTRKRYSDPTKTSKTSDTDTISKYFDGKSKDKTVTGTTITSNGSSARKFMNQHYSIPGPPPFLLRRFGDAIESYNMSNEQLYYLYEDRQTFPELQAVFSRSFTFGDWVDFRKWYGSH